MNFRSSVGKTIHGVLKKKKRVVISPIPENFTVTPLPRCDIILPTDVPEILPGNMYNPDTREFFGPRGREPTRYGDWESKGRCWDF